MGPDARPAEMLSGSVLAGGWTVVQRVPRPPGSTGGMSSVGYLVERMSVDGRVDRAFLKALDMTVCLGWAMPTFEALRVVTNLYGFERDLVMRCAGLRLSKVIRSLEAGEAQLDPASMDPRWHVFSEVPYIIFEEADGDLRAAVADVSHSFEAAWSFRALKDVAHGLQQLHGNDVEHLDLKPSNVMSVPGGFKIGDLGRATHNGDSPLNGHLAPGDPNHQPPEIRYGWRLPDDRIRRRSIDTYHLGSIAVFTVTGCDMTSLLFRYLDPTFHPGFPGGYASALPFVRDAFDVVVELVGDHIDLKWRSELIQIVRELCDPEPERRGSARRGSGLSRYSMDRYVSKFNKLALRAEGKFRSGLL